MASAKTGNAPQRLICTFIGEDRPGLVRSLAEVITVHNGNWLESSMAQLSGYFAGIIRMEVNAESGSDLSAALENLGSSFLSVRVREDSVNIDPVHPSQQQGFRLNIVGNDRPGIVHEITQALSNAEINVIEMTTEISSAPMSGDLLFHATMALALPSDTDVEALESQLEEIGQHLSVEIDLAGEPD